MESAGKTCPRCEAKLHSGDGVFELVRRRVSGFESAPGLPVIIWTCPKCGYIEFYSLKVMGRI